MVVPMVPPHIPLGSQGTCPCPRHPTPCKGTERSRRGPPPSWPLSAETVWPQEKRFPSQVQPGIREIHCAG